MYEMEGPHHDLAAPPTDHSAGPRCPIESPTVKTYLEDRFPDPSGFSRSPSESASAVRR
jgi:hypothetical protein